jgi:hypothetical protein
VTDQPQRPIPYWQVHLADLLAGHEPGRPASPDAAGPAGAELVVTDPGGREAFRAPLARHHRVDEHDPQLIWIRPIIGGYAPADPSSEHDYLFHLSTARRRGLHFLHAAVDDSVQDGDRAGDVVLRLYGGQSARISQASGPARTQLWLWDQFLSTALTAEQARQLAQLREDSWIGPYD